MTVAQEVGRVQRHIEDVWGYVKEMNNWAVNMPGYVDYQEVSEDVSLWTLKVEAGMFKRDVEFTVTKTEFIEPTELTFTLKAKKEGIVGSGSFKASIVDEQTTDIEINLQMVGKGMMEGMINNLLAKTLPNQCKELKDNIKQVLESEEVKSK
ncbi:hypothetical protein AJ85_01045 [Alkalihalobacillus alcalophilus ATCC 27647 = CGMCC 1.3604]|uniref:Carbon monoxide dehydrogenase n=1 Tax=Alkalihalobacillus alcalophilus ATCC 27647 = CGMCC 1.3604 TaxID=1218173 RepID=A0A094WE35_ALKAL|nr:SRPBCC family protein [Alkalihalobacillus alcalophilus]KGA96019.1 hypothetical protein BALCAV_0218725 [Alkalihalobacillus alcalophilus ATCC 27647 = CGMCC 1.3604]MED1561282.1 SRPBCC family protein [Alkalihalobacillus alcalophilus]THG91867.1 hypothetical protein AJ85_01045 [Alkalihalobacillus alcalophilus ATCC 27647 = CGMCC 1.3604]